MTILWTKSIIWSSLSEDDPADHHRRGQLLQGERRLVDALYDVNATDHLAEGGEALAVGVALAAEVERGLVAESDEEVGGGGIGAVAGHGESTFAVL